MLSTCHQEDGEVFPAEEPMLELFKLEPNAVISFVSGIMLNPHVLHAYKASFLFIFRHIHTEDDMLEWLAMLYARIGLTDLSVEVRDQAVCLLEVIENPLAVDILRAHKDNENWLQAYIDTIIREREGQ